jgi:TolB protein
MNGIATVLCFLSLSAAAQDRDFVGEISKNVSRPTIAVPELRGVGAAQSVMNTYNSTFWSELAESGALKMAPKDFYPVNVPQQPADFKPGGATLGQWYSPPVSANYLAFGYASVQDSTVVLFGWLFNVGQPDPVAAKLIGKLYYGSLDAAGAKKVAREFAADILRQFGVKSLTGTKIYFVSDRSSFREIWSMDYDGANPQQVTSHKSTSRHPAVSPDAKILAYTSLATRSGEKVPNWQVMLQSTETGRRLPFNNPAAPTTGWPEFARDGRRVLFASTLTDWAQIYAANLDGSDRRRLTNINAIDVSPRVNPKTGTDVLFISGRSGKQQLWRMNIDGGDLEMITNGEGEVANPAWSPDGRLIAFSWTQGFELGGFNIFVMDIATRKPIQLTKDSGVNENPWFAPDGLHIVYSSKRGNSTQIFTMLLDGTNVRNITQAGNNTQPVWAAALQ